MREYTGPNTLLSAFRLIRQAIKSVSFSAGDGLSETGDTLSVSNPNRGILTQTEFDALTEEQKASGTCFVDDGGGASGSSWEVYSTEETRIGTWIDGKPLYRKTFKTSHSAVSNKSWLDCGTIQDLEYGMVVNGTVTVPSENNILNLQSSLFRTRITKNNGIVAFYPENFSSDVVTVSCVTVEYTKTTDEGGTT